MLLFHYSDKDLTVIDPEYIGSHNHTPGDSWQPRSYYYLSKDYREKFFISSSYRYTVDTGDSGIYDTYHDKPGLFLNLTTNDLITKLKDLGFTGLSFRQPSGINVVCLFYSQKIIRKEVLNK